MERKKRNYKWFGLCMLLAVVAFSVVFVTLRRDESKASEAVQITTEDGVIYTVNELPDGNYSADVSFDAEKFTSQEYALEVAALLTDGEKQYTVTQINSIAASTHTVGEGEEATEVSNIKSIRFANGITRIKEAALNKYADLTDVTLPTTLTNAREGFVLVDANDKSKAIVPAWLQAMEAAEDGIVYTADGKIALWVKESASSEITFASGCTQIAGRALYGNKAVTKVTVSDEITDIGNGAFGACTSLTSVAISENSKLAWLGFQAFGEYGSTPEIDCGAPIESIYLPERVFYTYSLIEERDAEDQTPTASMFMNSRVLKNVVIGACEDTPEDNGREIGIIPSQMFYNCVALEAVKINGSNIDYIGYQAFANDTGLRSVTLVEGLKEFKDSEEFSGCSSLTEITLPSTVEKISMGCFDGCTSLSKFNIKETSKLSFIGYQAFGWKNYSPYPSDTDKKGYNCYTDLNGAISTSGAPITSIYLPASAYNAGALPAGLFAGCHTLKSLTFGSPANDDTSTKVIPNQCFAFCTGLEEVSGTQYINEYEVNSFSGCSKIKELNLENAGKVGFAAFAGTGISEVTIPECNTRLGVSAFANCTSLKKMTFDSCATYSSNTEVLPLVNILGIGFGGSSCGMVLPYEQSTKKILSAEAYREAYPNSTALETLVINGNTIDEEGKEHNVFSTYYDSVKKYGYYFGWADMIPSLTTVELPQGMKSIPNGAFRLDYSLKNINIPESVETIGDYAFYGTPGVDVDFSRLTKLKSIGNYAFTLIDVTGGTICSGLYKDRVVPNNGGIKQLILPEGLEFIGHDAFYGQRSVTRLVIPSTIDNSAATAYMIKQQNDPDNAGDPVATKVGLRAFQYLNSLKELEIYGTLDIMNNRSWNDMFWNCSSARLDPTTVDSYGFRVDKLVLGENYSSTGEFGATDAYYTSDGDTVFTGALFYASSIREIDIQMDNIKNISSSMFNHAVNLTQIDIPDTVTSIGDYAFCDATGINELVIPDGVITIGDGAFKNMNITGIDIPDSVTGIGCEAFRGTKNLTSVELPASIDRIWDELFKDSGICSITIPKNVKSIASGAFYNTASLDSVYFEEESLLESIESYAFADSGISTVSVPAVKNIGQKAFEGTTNLKSFVIPDNQDTAVKINILAFKDSAIESITILDKDAVIMKPRYSKALEPAASDNTTIYSDEIPDDIRSEGEEAINAYLKEHYPAIPQDVTIYGYAVSTAQTYAEVYNNNNKFIALDAATEEGQPAYTETTNVVAPTCVDKGYTEHIFANNSDPEDTFSYKDSFTQPIGHKGDASYTWSEDYTTCTIMYTCDNDSEHHFEETVNSECVAHTDSTCVTDGKKVYEVSLTNEYGSFERKIEETIPATHTYDTKPEFTWAEDYSSCLAEYTCSSDDTHKVQIDAVVSDSVLEAATCKKTGKQRYTARVPKVIPSTGTGNIDIKDITLPDENDETAWYTDSVDVDIPVLNHVGAKPVEENREEATETKPGHYDKVIYCENCGAEMSRENVDIPMATPAPTVAPTAEPTVAPTAEPTATPPVSPTVTPTATPTVAPTATPTVSPTAEPTAKPTEEATPASDNDSSKNKLVLPKVNEIIKDAKSGAKYKVIAVDESANTFSVMYIAPKNTKVKKVVIPDVITVNGVKGKVIAIGENAFKDCKKLTSVTIGKNVITIGKNAFADCSKLKSITIKTTKLTAKSVKAKAFAKINAKARIKVPKSKLKEYKKLLAKKGLNGKKQRILK